MAAVPPLPFHFRGSLVLAARQFPRNRAAMVGFVILVLICLAAAFAPLVAPYDPVQIKLSMKLKPPSLEHLMGTDHFGRDVFSRMLYGGRTSLSVGLLVVGFAFALGVPLGLASGYFGGKIDNAMMRLVDAFLTFPPLLLAVALVGLLGPDIQNVMLALGLVQAPILARMVRGSTLAVREDVYVTAARALGASPLRIILSHLLRNMVSPIVVQLTVVFSAAVVAEASLSFLGFGT
jgi:peptide/nickel transport system permease protein